MHLVQTHLAEYIKKNVPNVLVGAVGLITQAQEAEETLQAGQSDLIFLARELLRVDFPLKVRSKVLRLILSDSVTDTIYYA